STSAITQSICDKLLISGNRVSDESAAQRILWKLGFDPPQFEDGLTRFRARLREFTETVLAVSPIEREEARDRVRAAGVNVFVSVEEFLDRLISYNIWLLATDHFMSKFVFDPAVARRAVGAVVGTSLESGGSRVSWSVN